jgi:hypothetical protein
MALAVMARAIFRCSHANGTISALIPRWYLREAGCGSDQRQGRTCGAEKLTRAMRFHLVYSGSLRASGNKSKPEDVRTIRDKFHPQLELLWNSHAALRRLRVSARVLKNLNDRFSYWDPPDSPLFDHDPNEPLKEGHVDLCEPIDRGGNRYIPLVRKSLGLACFLDIMFLRQEDPGELVLQGGDLDNRIKTLFDALRVPDGDLAQTHNPTYCLLESDTLIDGFRVSTGRLLVPETIHANEVHLAIEVTIKVLRVGNWNQCLMGD